MEPKTKEIEVLNTNSNKPGKVTAYPALLIVGPVLSTLLLKHEKNDLARQIENVGGWMFER